MKYVIIGVGGLVGANARYLLGSWVAQRWGTGFPFGTLVVNLTGCFALGLFATLARQLAWDDRWRLLIAIGFIGGYTTFSTFEYDTLKLLEEGRLVGAAALNIGGSVVLGLLAAFAGEATAHAVLALPGLLQRAVDVAARN
jgi:CrcB protein